MRLAVLVARAALPVGARRWGNRWLESPVGRARRYLAKGQTIDSFFATLNQREVRYVVLRWFETLPDVATHEDIDLLVADEDLSRIEDLFGTDDQAQTFDVYSASGVSGSTYLGMPYYPPELAHNILDSRCWYRDRFAVPDRQHHFLSLAYHLLFHKGSLSADHDYICALQGLCPAGQLDALNDFDALYAYLDSVGWVPELDTQRKLARRSGYLRKRLTTSETLESPGDMMIFIVRDWASHKDRLTRIVEMLRSVPLEVMHLWVFEEQARTLAKQAIRGGNWGRGPYTTSGGDPYAMIVCFDYHPQPPDGQMLEDFPYLGNAHYLVKQRIRDHLNQCVLTFRQANCLHSADDEQEAYRYLTAVYPDRVATVRHEVARRATYFDEPYPVQALLQTHRTRAKVEKIDFNGRLAIKKTFKYGNAAYLEREVLVHSRLSGCLQAIPPLLAHGDDYLILPWYEDELSRLNTAARHAKLREMGEQIVEILRFFYEQGYALIDFHPGNLLYCEEHGLKVFDFEFLYRYPRIPAHFDLAFDIKGVPTDFDGDLPSGHRGKGRTYRNTWQPVIGPLNRYASVEAPPR